MAYRAEIEIGVRGTEKLRDLRKTIEDLSNKVNKLDELANTFKAPIQSVLNYTKAVQQATAALDKAELGSRDEAEAIKATARAIAEENTVRARRLFLLESEIKKQQGILRAAPTTGTVELGPGGPGFSGGFTAGQRQLANEEAILRTRREENKLRRENLQISSREELFEIKLQNIRERNLALEKQRTKTREATSNAIIGGAFPLLFGQGVGAAVGGGIGGFTGGMAGGQLGFGLSLVGTAIGASFDALIQSSVDLAKALRQGGDAATYLENTLGYLDPTIKKQIQNLQNSGQTAAAAELAFQELSRTVGKEGAEAFLELGKRTESGTISLKKLTASFIAAGLAVNKFFSDAKFGKGNDFTQFLPQQFRPTSVPAAETETAAFRQRTAELSKNNDILRLQVQLTSLSAKNDLDRFVTIQKQIATKEYENELTKISIQLKNKEISIDQNRLLITTANLEFSKKLGEIERSRVEEIARRQQETARAADEAQRKAEAALKARISLQTAITDEQLKLVDINIREQEFVGGEEAALRRSLDLFAARVRLSETLLTDERDAALIEAQSNGTVRETLSLYESKLKNLQFELNLQNEITARRLAQLQVEKQLATARREQAIEDVALPIQQRQQDVQLGIAAFTQPEQIVEQQRLALEQRRRLQEGELPILREIAAIQTEINLGALDASALEAKEADLDASRRKLDVLRSELGLLDQLEQRQLKLQQFFATYGQLIQSVSGEIANAVTFGVSEMIRGTKTAEQVFAEFLNAVGSALLSAAQQMIAQYIAIGIARIFAGLGGGSLGSMGSGGGFGSFTGGAFGVETFGQFSGGPLAAGITPFAKGGVVGQPTIFKFADGAATRTGLMGEAGPEAIMPLQRGADGRLGVNAMGLREAMAGGGMGGGAPVLNMSFETTRFGDTEYVSRDQLEAAMAETRRQASRDGARRGMTMTLDKLQQSPQTRSRLGMR